VEGQKMKIQKFFVMAAIVCFVVGASVGTAMAEGCDDGFIQNETFDDTLRITGNEPCVIIGCTIQGDIRAFNLPYVLLLNNKVSGIILVDGMTGTGVANVIANSVLGGKITVREHQTAYVIENEALNGNIRVIQNVNAFVQKNIASNNIICQENTDLNSFFNFAGGDNSCE
jgi:hypothetical protein